MRYKVTNSPKADEDLLKHKKSGNKVLQKKIIDLLEELEIHPETGTGKPEKLKHREEETWSRRILGKHRLEYCINEDLKMVYIKTFLGHYGDK
jgi:toxin YoeB